MGELGNKLGLDELAGGAAGISKALLAEFIGESISTRYLLSRQVDAIIGLV